MGAAVNFFLSKSYVRFSAQSISVISLTERLYRYTIAEFVLTRETPNALFVLPSENLVYVHDHKYGLTSVVLGGLGNHIPLCVISGGVVPLLLIAYLTYVSSTVAPEPAEPCAPCIQVILRIIVPSSYVTVVLCHINFPGQYCGACSDQLLKLS